jgi:hypothetical protein
MTDVVDAYCELVAAGADEAALLELANRMSDQEKTRAFFRLLEERDRKVCMEALAAYRAAGGRWLHS